MNFHDYVDEFKEALDVEINHIQKRGSREIPIVDGHRLTDVSNRGKYFYSFTCDEEILFPDNTPVIIIYRGSQFKGELISVHERDLVIALSQKLEGGNIDAKMKVDPWFLLEELKQRLDDAGTAPSSNRRLAQFLLSRTYIQDAPNCPITFDALLPRIVATCEESVSPRYNESQEEAIDRVLQYKVSYIWGPPGTGKTSTLGLTVASLAHAGKSVLVLAHSNAAVDTAMQALAPYLRGSDYYNEGKILRFGLTASDVYKSYPMMNVREICKEQNPELYKELSKLDKRKRQLTEESRKKRAQDKIDRELEEIDNKRRPLIKELSELESHLVRDARVVGCTLSKATISTEIYNRRFDAVIIDEASMAFIPHCFYAATLAEEKIAVFGDFRQLAPIAQSESPIVEEWLKRDVFEEAGIIDRIERGQEDARLVMLNTQYRMHPDISGIVNTMFYKGRLKNDPSVYTRGGNGQTEKPLTFYDLSDLPAFCLPEKDPSNQYKTVSRFNILSALMAVELGYSSLQTKDESVGIITPYNAQSRLLQNILRDLNLEPSEKERVKASTVHKFQGSEMSLIVFDAVDSDGRRGAGKLFQGQMGSTAARLSNVALSRAQTRFIGLVDHDFFERNLDRTHTFRQFVDKLQEKSEYIAPRTGDDFWNFTIPGVSIYRNWQRADSAITRDLNEARSNIIVDWPERKLPFSISQIRSNASWRFRGSLSLSAIGHLVNSKVSRSGSFSPHLGIIGIDREILWLHHFQGNSSLIVRLNLAGTIKFLYRLFRLKSDIDVAAFGDNDKPFGSCPICNRGYYPQESRYGDFTVCCPVHERMGRKINPEDATLLASISNRNCIECGSQIVGRRNRNSSTIFLSCSDSKCRGGRAVGLKELL